MAYGFEGFAMRHTGKPPRLVQEAQDFFLGLQRAQLAPFVAWKTGRDIYSWIRKTGGVVDLTHEWETAVSMNRSANDNVEPSTLEKIVWDTLTLGSGESDDPLDPNLTYANRAANMVVFGSAIAGAIVGSLLGQKYLHKDEAVENAVN